MLVGGTRAVRTKTKQKMHQHIERHSFKFSISWYGDGEFIALSCATFQLKSEN